LKRVLALPGDWVAIHEDGTLVNGQPIANGARLVADRAGRSLPPLLAAGEVPGGHARLFSGHTHFILQSINSL